MINYRNGKKKYKVNELGSLYVDETKLNPNEQPVIYIGGQMEHRCHILEQTGYTGDMNHNEFTGSWFYDYPITSVAKSTLNAENFTENLLMSLKNANLHDVVLITNSYGGTIAAYATKSELVSKAIAVHPPILGTPLVNPSFVNQYKKMLSNRQRLILSALKVLINPEFGFEKENFNGINLQNVDLNKLIVVGDFLDIDKEQNALLKETYEMIRVITTFKSDGIVTFEPQELEKLGINYLQEGQGINHFESSSKNTIANAYKKVMK